MLLSTHSSERLDAYAGDPDFGVDVTDSLRNAGDVGAEVERLLSSHNVLLFGDSSPFGVEVERTLLSWGVTFAVVEVDALPAASRKAALAALKEHAGLDALPQLFVDGKFRGTCAEVKRQERSREMQAYLAKYINWDKLSAWQEARVRRTGFLFFPESVNGVSLRVAALLAFPYCILCIVFRDRPATRWAVLGLAVDSAVRAVGGPEVSVVGASATLLTSYFAPVWVAGPPRQSAAFFDAAVAVLAAGLYLAGLQDGGLIVLAILAAFSVIEAATDRSPGSLLFDLAFRLGLLPPDVYRAHLNLQLDRAWQHQFFSARGRLEPAESKHVWLPGQDVDTEIDLVRKKRPEVEFKVQDVGVLRHTTAAFYAVPLALAALAYAFKVLDNTYNNQAGQKDLFWGTQTVYGSLSIVSAVVFMLLTLVFLARLALYRRKVWKEWRHPVHGNFFSALVACLSLYGLLLYDYYLDFGVAVAWVGAVLQMMISVLRMGGLVYDYTSDDSVSPALLLGPIGNYLSALALATCKQRLVLSRNLLVSVDPYDSNGAVRGSISGVNYIFIARLWFAVASLFAVTLFIITFRRSFKDPHSDSRNRSFLWLWMGAASAAGPAYVVRYLSCIRLTVTSISVSRSAKTPPPPPMYFSSPCGLLRYFSLRLTYSVSPGASTQSAATLRVGLCPSQLRCWP